MAHRNEKSRDHFVSQTYLRNFCLKDDCAQIYSKRRGWSKLIHIGTICTEVGGDICNYYENKFAIRDILEKCEPLWNTFIKSIEERNTIEINAIWRKVEGITFLEWITLYFSYLRCLSPTTIQQSKKMDSHILNHYVLRSTPGLSDEEYELIKSKKITVNARNKEYHKAQSMKLLTEVAMEFYNKKWEILVNTSDLKFITSDTPFIPLMGSLYFPLTPHYALLIHPTEGKSMAYKKITQAEVKKFNKELVKYAVDLVISSDEVCKKLERLVNNCNNYQPGVDYTTLKSSPNSQTILVQHKAIPIAI